MVETLSPSEKQELIKLIVQAGLEEDFLKWLEQQGYKYFFGRLDNIPDELITTYVRVRRLTDLGEDEYKVYYELGEVEPDTKRNIIPSKKPKKA